MFSSCCIGICVKILTRYNAIMGSFCVGGRCFGARFFFYLGFLSHEIRD